MLIFGLVACSGKKEKKAEVASQRTTTTTPTIIKKPVIRDSRTDSYDFCENHGNEVIVRFDEGTETSKVYCRFPDTTECEADTFMHGTCYAGNGSTTYETKNHETEVIICSQSYDPVCGKNGITYSNACMASVNNIEIKYEGVCLETQTEENVAQEPVNTTAVITKEKPDWLDLIIDLSRTESVQSPRSYIDKCAYSSDILYYQFGGGNNSYSTLYNKDGQAICSPSNEINNDCPDYFKAGDRSRNCKRIWTDDR